MKTITCHMTNVQTIKGRRMGQGRTVAIGCAADFLSLSFADALRLEAVGRTPHYASWSREANQPHGDQPRPQQAGRPEASIEAGKPALGHADLRQPTANRSIRPRLSASSARS